MSRRQAITLVELRTKKLGAEAYKTRTAGSRCHVDVIKHLGIAQVWFPNMYFAKVNMKDLLSVVKYNDDRPGNFTDYGTQQTDTTGTSS